MKKPIKLFDLSGKVVYHFPHLFTPPERRFNMYCKHEKQSLFGLEMGNLLFFVGLACTGAGAYFAWQGHIPSAFLSLAVGSVLTIAGNAVSAANANAEAAAKKYADREAAQDIWRSIGDIETRLDEVQSKVDAKHSRTR
jgi:hypothetical protein